MHCLYLELKVAMEELCFLQIQKGSSLNEVSGKNEAMKQ